MRAALNLATPKNIRNPDMYVEGLLGYSNALRTFPAEIGARSTRPIARFFASVDEKKTHLFTSNSDGAQAWRLGLQRLCDTLVHDAASMELFASVFIDHAWNPVPLLERSKRYNQPHGVEPSEAYPAYICRALRSAIVDHAYQPVDHRTLHTVWEGLWDAGVELSPTRMTRRIGRNQQRLGDRNVVRSLEGLCGGHLSPGRICATASSGLIAGTMAACPKNT